MYLDKMFTILLHTGLVVNFSISASHKLYGSSHFHNLNKWNMILVQDSQKLCGNGCQTAVPKKLMGTVYFDKSCALAPINTWDFCQLGNIVKIVDTPPLSTSPNFDNIFWLKWVILSISSSCLLHFFFNFLETT